MGHVLYHVMRIVKVELLNFTLTVTVSLLDKLPKASYYCLSSLFNFSIINIAILSGPGLSAESIASLWIKELALCVIRIGSLRHGLEN